MTTPRPTVFLDLDDVLCPNEPYGGRHVYEALRNPAQEPAGLYTQLFSEEAVEVLNTLMEEFKPRIVLTTSWLSLLDRPHFEHVFNRCGLAQVAQNLHPHWDAPADRHQSRLECILSWMRRHHHGEAFLVVDDRESGQSLIGSRLDKGGRVVFCSAGRCLTRAQLEDARPALRLPVYQPFLPR